MKNVGLWVRSWLDYFAIRRRRRSKLLRIASSTTWWRRTHSSRNRRKPTRPANSRYSNSSEWFILASSGIVWFFIFLYTQDYSEHVNEISFHLFSFVLARTLVARKAEGKNEAVLVVMNRFNALRSAFAELKNLLARINKPTKTWQIETLAETLLNAIKSPSKKPNNKLR